MATLTGNPDLVDPGFDHPPANPMALLKQWLLTADQLNISEPRGLVLSTVNAKMQPSSRVVLLKDCDETGIVFASSALSAKGQDLQLNPSAAGTLWWRETMQQINFQGRVKPCSAEFSDTIFYDRPISAQAVANVSKQSVPLIDEAAMKAHVAELLQQSELIKRPADWHAYHFVIESIEFWHGSKDRFHKRLRYTLANHVWNHQMLQP
jgi:pyridoxamine-phosphate oxidase